MDGNHARPGRQPAGARAQKRAADQAQSPILTNDDIAKLRKNQISDFRSCTIAMRFRKPESGSDKTAGELLRDALDQMCREAKAAIDEWGGVKGAQKVSSLTSSRPDVETP